MTEIVQFRVKIAKQGDGRIIYIPKEYLGSIKQFEDEYVNVTLEATE
jgi:antitoxin component of MazEF toxin-antitoxin module